MSLSVLIFASCVVALTTAALHPKLAAMPLDTSVETFKFWKSEFDIQYTSDAEEIHRYQRWTEGVKRINQHNMEGHRWTQGVNAFTALTWDEFNALNLMVPQDCSATEHHNKPMKEKGPPPPQIDWRQQMVVSEVKNQGSCGSCWSFSTTGCLESAVAIANKQMTLFSEQNLVDCAWAFNNFGCNGGLPSQAFEYIRYNGGIDSEFSYSYFSGHTKTNGTCKYTSTAGTSAGMVYEVYNVTEYDEMDLGQQVGTVGPVAICFDVVSGFSSYSGGVYESSTCGNTSKTVNHAVLAVGYGTEHNPPNPDVDYWIVKNSWGWNWGVDGYFKIIRHKNMCGLASCASYPIVDPGLLA